MLHLRHIQSAVIVAIAALRRQNCELDEDIAGLLQRCVCDRIADQLEMLEGLGVSGRSAPSGQLPMTFRRGGGMSRKGPRVLRI